MFDGRGRAQRGDAGAHRLLLALVREAGGDFSFATWLRGEHGSAGLDPLGAPHQVDQLLRRLFHRAG
jgi:hypothetical protein